MNKKYFTEEQRKEADREYAKRRREEYKRENPFAIMRRRVKERENRSRELLTAEMRKRAQLKREVAQIRWVA